MAELWTCNGNVDAPAMALMMVMVMDMQMETLMDMLVLVDTRFDPGFNKFA